MNTGLVDAIVLGQILADVLHGERTESALDAYEELRRPAAARVLALAGFLTKLATVRGAGRQAIRNLFLSILNVLPPLKNRLLMNLSGLSRRAMAELPPAAGGGAAAKIQERMAS